MQTFIPRLGGVALAALSFTAGADAITDWNLRSAQFVGDAKLGTPPSVRVMALVQTAAYEAARDASRGSQPSPQAIDTAIAAAHRTALGQLLPTQRAAVDSTYQAVVAALPADPARAEQLALGERAALRVLAVRATEMPRTPETYRPHTTPGAYVPTVSVAAPLWPQRKPWLLQSADQFRPAAPPSLSSATWVRDFNEIKALGGRDSAQRSAEQTEIGRFWDYSLPAIYHGVVRSVALQPGRDVLTNARLFATVAQAMDDAVIAVMDAKYTYNFWRPVTAIRNGDIDGNDATAREASWAPLIETPMHPEYPCAHCTLGATVATVLKAESRGKPLPELTTASPTGTAPRRWSTPEAFMQEVALARIVAGVHYRNSTDAGLALGQNVGAWAWARSEASER